MLTEELSRVCYVQDLQVPRYRAQQGREPSVFHHLQQLRIPTKCHGHQDGFLRPGRQEKKDEGLSGSAAFAPCTFGSWGGWRHFSAPTSISCTPLVSTAFSCMATPLPLVWFWKHPLVVRPEETNDHCAGGGEWGVLGGIKIARLVVGKARGIVLRLPRGTAICVGRVVGM